MEAPPGAKSLSWWQAYLAAAPTAILLAKAEHRAQFPDELLGLPMDRAYEIACAFANETERQLALQAERERQAIQDAHAKFRQDAADAAGWNLETHRRRVKDQTFDVSGAEEQGRNARAWWEGLSEAERARIDGGAV